MNHYHPVTLTGHLAREFAATGKARPTKTWLRAMLKDGGNLDWRNECGCTPFTYISSSQAEHAGFTLEVHHNGESIALVDFKVQRVVGPAAYPGQTRLAAVVR